MYRRPALWPIAALGLIVSVFPLTFALSPATAAVTITVDTLTLSPAGAGNTATNCVDSEAAPKCSLNAAIAAANAVASGDGSVVIEFASGLTNPAVSNTPNILLESGNSKAMRTTDAGSGLLRSASSPLGYAFDVNAQTPVTIDFGGAYGIVSPDTDLSAFLIESPDVTVTGLTQAQAGRNFFSVSAPRATISDTTCTNASTYTSGGSNYQEACVALLTGADDVELDTLTSNMAVNSAVVVDGSASISGLRISDSTFVNSTGFDGAGGGLLVDGLGTLTNASIENTTFADNAVADIQVQPTATLDGLRITGSTFTRDGTEPAGSVRSPGNGAIWIQGNDAVVRDLVIDGCDFLEPTYGIRLTGSVAVTGMQVTNSTFDGGTYAYNDNSTAETIDRLTWSGNTFRDMSSHVLDFTEGAYTDLLVDNNTFTDVRAGALTMVYASQVGTNNVVSNNTVSVSSANLTDTAYTNTWFFYANMSAATATTDTGWSAVGNHVDGIQGGDSPMIHYGRGVLPMIRNTFGQNTSGTTTTDSEGPSKHYFASNAGGGSNNNIQTWRPSDVVLNGVQATFTVAPVDPVTGGDATQQPTTPVTLHVYWTADDNAEEYLGAIASVSSAGSVSIPTSHINGFLRIQTQQASPAATSQYSAVAASTFNPLPTPTPTPTPTTTGTPTPSPSPSPTENPTPTPTTPTTTATATAEPTDEPSDEPTKEPEDEDEKESVPLAAPYANPRPPSGESADPSPGDGPAPATGADRATTAGSSRSEPSLRSTFAPYDPRQHPAQTIATGAAAASLALMAGGLGSRRRGALGARRAGTGIGRRRRSGDAPEVDMSQEEFHEEAVEPGDRSWTWHSPLRARVDELGRQLPNRLNEVSPMIARFVNDAAYLRAMFGSFSLLTPILGGVLGVVAANQAHREALPPSLGLLVGIIVLSIFDSLGGVAAALTYTASVVLAGNVTDAPTLRALIAVDIVFFSVILVVSATRDLRRDPAQNRADWFDRLADVAIGTMLAMWTAKAALGALPGLTGLDLPQAAAGWGVLLVIGAAALVRFLIETVAAHWYPKRLLVVAPPEIESTPDWRRWVTLAVEVSCFTFFAASYMGTSGWLWLGAALVFASVTMDDWADLLPDWPFLAKLIPGGIIGMLFYFVLGAWSGSGFQAVVHDPAKVAEIGFVVLMIPGFICSVIAATTRNGDGWNLTWPIRWLGIPMLVLTALVVTGAVPVI